MEKNALGGLFFGENLVVNQPGANEVTLVAGELDILAAAVFIDTGRCAAVEGTLHGAGNTLEVEVVVEALDEGHPLFAVLAGANMNLLDFMVRKTRIGYSLGSQK